MASSLALAFHGLRDALRLHAVPHYCAPRLLATGLAAILLNLALYAAVTQWQRAHDTAARPPWAPPLQLAVLALSARLNGATADAAVARRRNGPPPPPPRGRRALVRAPTLRGSRDAAAFRGLLSGGAFAQATLVGAAVKRIHPPLATLLSFVAAAAAYAWCLFDAPFTAARAPLSARLAALETAWPYYLAFGAVAAAPGVALAGWPAAAAAAAGAAYPLFTVLAVDAAGPPRPPRRSRPVRRLPVLAVPVTVLGAVVGTRRVGPLVLRVAGGSAKKKK